MPSGLLASRPWPTLSETCANAATPANDRALSRRSRYSGYDVRDPSPVIIPVLRTMYGRTRRAASVTPGGGRKKSESTTPKIVLTAPIPNARQSTAIAVNPGVRHSARTPTRTSRARLSKRFMSSRFRIGVRFTSDQRPATSDQLPSVIQHHRRIHLRRTARWQVARQHRHAGQHGEQRDRITGAYAVEQAGEQTRERQRARESDRHAQGSEHGTALHDEPQ